MGKQKSDQLIIDPVLAHPSHSVKRFPLDLKNVEIINPNTLLFDYDNLLSGFKTQLLNYVNEDDEGFDRPQNIEIKASGEDLFSDEFLELDVEELFKVSLSDGNSSSINIISNSSNVKIISIQRELDKTQTSISASINIERNEIDNFNLPPLQRSVTTTPAEVILPPPVDNGQPTAIDLIAGPAPSIAFENALRTQPFATLSGNIFNEGAATGPDGLFSLLLSPTRAGSVVSNVLFGSRVTTPEGNTFTLYHTSFAPLNLQVGDYEYQLNNAPLHLAGPNILVFNDPISSEELFVEHFEYTIQDGSYDISTAKIFVQIADDSPTATDQNAPAIDEANILTIGTNLSGVAATVNGTLISAPNNVYGPDGGVVSNVTIAGGVTDLTNPTFITVTTVEGNVLSINRTTSDYTYALNNAIDNDGAHPNAVDAQAIDEFIYTFTDFDGDTASAKLAVTIIDDQPVATDNTNAVDETLLFVNGTESVSGNLLTDNNGFGLDLLSADSASIFRVNGVTDGGVGDIDGLANGVIVTQTDYDTGSGLATGKLSVTLATGAYTFDLIDVTAIADAQLQTKHVSTYSLIDSDNDIATANLTITIDLNQTPDAINDAISTDEDNNTVYAVPGVLTNDTDDANDVIVVNSINTAGTMGVVNFLANGEIKYDPNGQFETLALGEQAIDTFTYTVIDAEGLTDTATVTVTINGVNDLPTLTGDADSVTEDTTLQATGNITFDDIDTTNVNTLSITSADGLSTVETMVDNPDGSKRNNTVDVTVAGLYGSMLLKGDGSWQYDLTNGNATVQALAQGETLTETFAVSYSDAAGSANDNIVITINGNNDLPTLTGDADSVTEDTTLQATGNITFDDIDTTNVNTLSITSADGLSTVETMVDNPDGSKRNNTVDVTVAGLYGSMLLKGDGSWQYDLTNGNATVQALAQGETLTETFAVSYSDAAGSANDNIVITINGNNDLPTLTGDADSVTEDTTLQATGNITFDDIDTTNVNTLSITSADGLSTVETIVDNPDGSKRNNTVDVTVAGLYGSMLLKGDGSWQYDLTNGNATVQALTQGETLTETFAVSYSDAAGSTNDNIVITINGTNDAPVVALVDNDHLEYNEGSGAVIIEQGGGGNVSDIDSDNFDTGSMIFEITNNAVPAEDVLSIQDQGVGAGQIGFDGINITYEGTQIGTVNGASTATKLIMDFNANSNPTNITELILAVTYENTTVGAPDLSRRTVTITITDGDGGTSNLSQPTIDVNDVIPPVVLDLDGDGIELISSDQNTILWKQDESQLTSGWVDADDAILVYDTNLDGTFNDFSEINLTLYHPDATTDLEALRLGFDSNRDNVFNAEDELFEYFALWQDMNQDGVSQTSEFTYLSDSNILNIYLQSDKQSSVIEDNIIYGMSFYETKQGESYELADVGLILSNTQIDPLTTEDVLYMDNDNLDVLLSNSTEATGQVFESSLTEPPIILNIYDPLIDLAEQESLLAEVM